MIRVASESDWTDISRISAASGYMDYIGNMGPRYLGFGETYVFQDVQIQGFCKLEVLPDHSVHLSGLRVLPEARRRGVAMELTRYLLDSGARRGCRVARILVESGNNASLYLSRKIGFTEVEHFHFFQGTIDTRSFSRSVNEPSYHDIGWKFILPGESESDVISFKRGGVKFSTFSEDRGDEIMDTVHYTIFSGGHLEIQDGKGVISVPERCLGSTTGLYRPMEGFSEAFLLEKDLTQ